MNNVTLSENHSIGVLDVIDRSGSTSEIEYTSGNVPFSDLWTLIDKLSSIRLDRHPYTKAKGVYVVTYYVVYVL